MGLPLLNSAPKYEVKIPSSGEVVRFRPFLVKEQKVLLIAYESKDKKQIINAMLDCISNCITDDINVYNLSTFDADYLFTQIRSKSVGEGVDILLACEDCRADNDIHINLDEIQVEITKKEEVVKLTNEISVKMSYPTYARYLQSNTIFDATTSTDLIMEIIISCIDSIMTEEENINARDESREDLITFIDSMTQDQFMKLSQFIEDMPVMKQDINFKCQSCGYENKRTLEGIDDFF